MKVSIITVVYNGAKFIRDTIESVINQSYKCIEYVVIDGSSTDETLPIIDQYSEHIDVFVSESDKGVYDAMNKGVSRSTGEWIIFMNCGDIFFDNDVLRVIFGENDHLGEDIIYGDAIWKFNFGETLITCSPISQNNCMPFSHQSVLVKRSLLQNNPFDLKFKICSDRNFFYRSYVNQRKFKYVPVVVSKVLASEGISRNSFVKVYREVSIIENKKRTIIWWLKFLGYFFKDTLKSTVYLLLPRPVIYRLGRMRLK